MIRLSTLDVAVAAVVMALWLIGGATALVLGLLRMRRARAAEALADDLARLLERAPAVVLRVTRDGRLEATPRAAEWLGAEQLPERLADLANADTDIRADDLAGLADDLVAAVGGGGGFARPLHIGEGRRVLLARGRATAEGDAEVWLFDASDSQETIERLEGEVARQESALEGIAALIEAAPFPMWLRGPDLRLALVNSAYVRAVEAADAADVVERGLELVEGEAGRGPLAAAAAAQGSGETSVRTAPATLGGERRMIRIVDVPLGAVGLAGYAVDVDELEEARADLGRFVQAQRDLLDTLSAGVAQFGPDRGLVFTNHPFQRLFAMKAEWLADQPEFDRVLERMRDAGRVPESREFPRWKAERRAWFTLAEPSEESWQLPGGTHLRVLAQPLPDGGLLLIFEDRTEQVQLASARDTLLRVRTATFDNLFEAVGVFASDGRLNLWNNRFREVWGLTDRELGERPRVDMLVETVADRLANPARAGLIRELVRMATVERQQRSGRVALADGRHFEFAVVPLPDGNALFTMLDISASRQIEAALRGRTDALEEADRLKTAFVAKMSYELRVPLTSITGFAEMLAGGYAGDLGAGAADYVGAILASTARLAALIENTLDLIQSEAGSLPLAAEPVDLHALADEAAESFAGQARTKGLDLAVEILPGAGTVAGDARRLRQAIDHLLRNAVTYVQPGGRVLFRVDGDDESAEIVVSDNGPGIPEAEQARLFDQFHRASGDGRATLGVGLPLTRRLIEAHGGSVTLMSEPGEGTALILRLPRTRTAE